MRKYAITAAVLAGSLVLFVPLTVTALLGALETIGELFGLEPATGGAVTLLAVALGYVTAMEIARVRLHGFDELDRGSWPRRIARHAVLAAVSLAAGVVLADLLVEGVAVGIGNGQPVVAAGAAASLVALAWVTVRSLRAFRGGVRRPARPQ
ncbi:hypothetical protein [Saliphagus infecundisoli]|uniref:Uncharacterized protein n=1 Tax=Saliphagus infecundisoli TaxID=1849069 RepID=A0ABD5QBK9_9EURY|nr:hypothetical protein [Saliphagus infecundisoli]